MPSTPIARAAILIGALGSSLAVLAQTPVAAQEAAPTVVVTRFNISGNSLLPQAALDAAVAPFVGRRSIAELQQAAAAVQQLYRDAGYGAVVVYLPEQNPAGGQVALRVVEGHIREIVVVGGQRTTARSLQDDLPELKPGRTPNLRQLDAQVQLANQNPARQLGVVLEPGPAGGDVDARVAVTERPVTAWTLSAENTGTPQTGRWRAGLGWRHADLWGRSHLLTIQGQTSVEKPSAVRIGSVAYSVPLPEWTTRWDVYAARSNVDGGATATAAGSLQFVGRGNVFGTRVTRLLPRLADYEQRVTIGLDRREYLNHCTIAGLPEGACGAAGESVAVTPLTLEYAFVRGGDAPQGAHVSMSHNLGVGGAHTSAASFDAVRAGARPSYTAMRLDAQMQRPLGGSLWRWQLRVLGQFTPDALVPGEQFGLAGASVVRGYDEREVVGDNALATSFEIWSPEFEAPGALGRGWRGLAFADAGRTSNRRDAQCRAGTTSCTLAALGIGLRSGQGPWQLRADLAVALKDGNRTERNDVKIHVSASATFE